MVRSNKEKALKLADEIIKNTYRTLMTRGQKGCFIYCEDKPLAEYLKNRILNTNKEFKYDIDEDRSGYLLKVAEDEENYKT